MEEQKELRLKLYKHIIYNLIGFAVIFIIFGVFIYCLVSKIAYSNVNKALYDSKNQFLEIDNERINLIINSKGFKEITRSGIVENAINSYEDIILTRKIINPNIIVVLRNMDGEIVNESQLIRIDDYFEDIDFNNNNLDKIYELTIGDKYSYRGINFIFKGSDVIDDRYVQLLINVDTEKAIVASYFQIISVAIIVGIVCSIFASIVLSWKTLSPLEENMIKQIEFVQNVSHELRTPLTIIQAKQELLLQEPNAKIIDKSEDISLTLNETRRLTKLVKDLLILSRADSKKLILQKENINIDEYINEIVNPYIEIAQMQDKNLELNLNYKLDIDVDTKTLAEDMTKAGNEYDSAEKLVNATNLVIGEIKSCKPHPDSDHLHLCKVDVGTEILDIVCGAPNAREGIKVIVALPGAELPGGIKIKSGVIRGEQSNGMMCALYEIGIDKKYLSEEDKNGI